jgi:hypothetical protein
MPLNDKKISVFNELLPVIISHQTPTYFTGLIHEVSSILDHLDSMSFLKLKFVLRHRP